MTWLMVIGLALAVFAVAAFLLKLDKGLWTSLGAALGFGLAGYALQASPGLPAAPKSGEEAAQAQQVDMVQARREFVAQGDWSPAPMLVTSDAMARRGRFEEAARLLEDVTRQNPRDFEAWLAQGIALTEHAGGAMTQASLYAYQQAAAAKPDSIAPGYFLGVSLVQQGRLMEARQVWAETLASGPEDAAGRAGLEDRLARLDGILGAMQSGGMPPAEASTDAPATE
jgi:cytochrome c-type biogenesis protein CcmH